MNFLHRVQKIVTPNSAYNPPPKGWVQYADMISGEHTPDLPFLEQFEYIRLFVYDRMMQGGSYNNLLGPEAERVAYAFTKNPFRMYTKDLGKESFPIIMRPDKGDHLVEKCGGLMGPAHIRGELFKVRPLTFLTLDKEMENGYVFTRKRIRLLVPTKIIQFQRERVAEVEGDTVNAVKSVFTEAPVIRETRAFVYVGTEYWREQVADKLVSPFLKAPNYLISPSEMRRHNNSKLDPYYIFDRKELNGK